MTNPAGMPSNEDIVASVHDLELEGGESSVVANQVVTFIKQQQMNFSQALGNAQAQIAALSETAMSEATRQSINDSLKAVKDSFDGTQRVLLAAITSPDTPLPPTPAPTPEPTPDTPPDSGPLGGSRGRSRGR